MLFLQQASDLGAEDHGWQRNVSVSIHVKDSELKFDLVPPDYMDY